MDTKNQIGGCLFFFVGSIIFGFAIFLIKSGINSQRSTEIDEYIEDVNMWTSKYKSEFESLIFEVIPSDLDETYSTLIPKIEGEKTAELDVSFAIGR